MNYSIKHTELTKMLEKASCLGAKRALEEAGVSKKTISLAEIKKKYGKPVAEMARNSNLINWVPIGKGGLTSGVVCLVKEFDKYLTSVNIEATKIKSHANI